MHYFIYPIKDATIYKEQPVQNTGLDEVLEVQKAYYASNLKELSRALVKWNLSSLSQSIVDNSISSPRFYLNLEICAAEEIPLDYTIYAYAVSQSWEMGVGTKYDGVTTTGVSWRYIDSAESGSATVWSPNATYAAGTTGSHSGYGGTWYTGSGYEASQSFSYSTGNMRMDVTDVVNTWISGTIPNEGFILKHTTEVEEDLNDYGILKFFSMDTSTVYPPKLEMVWDDSSFVTGSLTALTEEDIVIYMKGLKAEYKDGSKIKFRVVGRERHPAKTFSTSSQYNTVKYLSTSSFYYSIRDAETEETIIPFDDYTKVSCDSSGNYFTLWLNGLQPERYYEIIYKVVGQGTEEYFENNFTFKLVR